MAGGGLGPGRSRDTRSGLTGGRAALRDLGERLVRWRVGWQWYVLVILGPAAFSLAIAGIYALLGGSWSAAVPKALSEEPLVLLPAFFCPGTYRRLG